MFGTFQTSELRIEISATAQKIRDSLTQTDHLRQWLFPQTLSDLTFSKLSEGVTFTTYLGLIPVEHQVLELKDNCLKLLLSKGIDGYHEWYWGEGWIQSRLEGVSLLPLNLGQTFSLWRLRWFLNSLSS